MSFPARKVFSRDRRRGLTDILVYEFLELELDDKEPTTAKLAWVAHGTQLREPHVSKALKNLVAWGYLKDHRKHDSEPRALTLVRVLPARVA